MVAVGRLLSFVPLEYISQMVNKKSYNKSCAIAFVLFVICLVLIIFLFVRCEQQKSTSPIFSDDNAVIWDGEQELYRPTVNNRPAIAIPGIKEIIFSAGTKTQQVNFYNPKENTCYFQMDLYVDGERLWKSGNVAPGNGYYTIELDKSLSVGEREGILQIRCFKKDGTELNSAQVKFNLIVQEV